MVGIIGMLSWAGQRITYALSPGKYRAKGVCGTFPSKGNRILRFSWLEVGRCE